MTGQQRRRRWRHGPRVSSALVGHSGLPGWGSGRNDADRRCGRPIGDAGEQDVNRDLMTAALGGLTQEHRDVLGELYLRGSSVAQAAHALGIAPGMVKSRMYYALRALRLTIEELRDIE
jgi:DNA-directed RNA polymerase specialized sigma24 family protein